MLTERPSVGSGLPSGYQRTSYQIFKNKYWSVTREQLILHIFKSLSITWREWPKDFLIQPLITVNNGFQRFSKLGEVDRCSLPIRKVNKYDPRTLCNPSSSDLQIQWRCSVRYQTKLLLSTKSATWIKCGKTTSEINSYTHREKRSGTYVCSVGRRLQLHGLFWVQEEIS